MKDVYFWEGKYRLKNDYQYQQVDDDFQIAGQIELLS